jgi:hypothetical protein
LNSKLQPDGYSIFRGNPQLYSDDNSLFSFGFLSELQQQKLSGATTMCLDATYGICAQSSVIMYSIVIRDDDIDRGFPGAYMFTNDQTIGSITQWLQFLKERSFIVDPQQITIDCSHIELTAIRTIFPGCAIQYCLFHVSQAWGRQLALKVKSDTGMPADNRVLRREMMAHLKVILYEKDPDVFESLIDEFKVRYAAQDVFIDYFERNWCGEDKYNI